MAIIDAISKLMDNLVFVNTCPLEFVISDVIFLFLLQQIFIFSNKDTLFHVHGIY